MIKREYVLAHVEVGNGILAELPIENECVGARTTRERVVSTCNEHIVSRAGLQQYISGWRV